MAKLKDKIKKDSDSKKTKESKESKEISKRGRPSSKKSNEETHNEEKVKPESKKEDKSETPKQPKLSETELLLQSIYGDEPIKDAVPLPVSEQKTQTTTIVNEYNINIQRLPQGVLDLVNAFASVFTTILQNPLMASNYINDFLDKDTKSLNAIKEWVEPRKDALMAYKVKTKGGDSTAQNVSSKVVIDANNINNVNNIPNKPVNTPQPPITHGQNPLTPRNLNGGGTYQHHIHSNPIQNHPVGTTENKSIHYEMLSKHNHFADVHLQQNPLQHIEQKPVVTPQQYIQDYANGIMSVINSYFRMAHSGYIEYESLQTILNGLDKSFTYEVIRNGAESYINISKGEDKVTTPKFNIFG